MATSEPTATENRPECATDELLTYLDDLRKGGSINMFAAAPALEFTFMLDDRQARDALMYWMRTFSERHGTAASS